MIILEKLKKDVFLGNVRVPVLVLPSSMAGGAMATVLAALLPITILQLTLIHIDHAVPPRCINVLDISCERLPLSPAMTAVACFTTPHARLPLFAFLSADRGWLCGAGPSTASATGCWSRARSPASTTTAQSATAPTKDSRHISAISAAAIAQSKGCHARRRRPPRPASTRWTGGAFRSFSSPTAHAPSRFAFALATGNSPSLSLLRAPTQDRAGNVRHAHLHRLLLM